jgi:ABC-type multidrug transport system fused ATPase/permease subunit
MPAGSSSIAATMTAGILGALVSVAAGSFLRDHAGGSEPLMAIFPILMLVSVRWGIVAGLITLAIGTVGAWYVYIGEPFSFEISSSQAASLAVAAVIGGLILTMCAALTGVIAQLREANAASSNLTDMLTARSTELSRLNDELARALEEQARSREAIDFSETQFRVSFEYAAVGKV